VALQRRRKARKAASAWRRFSAPDKSHGIPLHVVIVALPHVLQNIPHLVHPAALMQHPRMNVGIAAASPAQPSVTMSSKLSPAVRADTDPIYKTSFVPVVFSEMGNLGNDM